MWNRLPRAVVKAKALEFKECLDNFRHSIWILGGALWNRELGSTILIGPFQLGIFYFLLPCKGLVKMGPLMFDGASARENLQ